MIESYDTSVLGWRFFLWWMLAFLGIPVGGYIAFELVGPVEGVVSGAMAGALAGVVIGAAQWLVLRRFMDVGMAWVVATAVGVATGDALGAWLTAAGTEIRDLLVVGLVTGVAVGFSQWMLLKGHVPAANLWVPVATAAWPVGWAVTWAAGIDVERGYAMFSASGALVFAAITVVAIWLMSRGGIRAALHWSSAR